MPSLRETVARLFMAGLPGPTLDDETRRLHTEFPFGGVVLFKRNAAAPAAMRALIRTIHRLDPSLPPLVAIDHEGGRVHRLAPPFTHFPAAARIAAAGPRTVHAVATAMARELAAIGVDLTFAPVLDVATNPANTVIGDRAYGREATVVARAALATFRTIRAAGLLACGKHFPGHGATTTDSHLELPEVDRSRATLSRIDLLPFRRAVAAGMPMLMTAHVRYPALDPTAPATLSSAILGGLLRQRMRFRGVICSDDLAMRAIADDRGPGEAAVAALAAGADLLLTCQDQEHLRRAALAVEEAVRRGRLAERRVADAYARVVRLTRTRRRAPVVRLSVIGCRAHVALATALS